MTRTKIIPLYERLSCDDEYVRCFLLVDFFENSETSLYIAIDGKYTGHILKAIQISRKCLRIVYQNIVLSIATTHSAVSHQIIQKMKAFDWGLLHQKERMFLIAAILFSLSMLYFLVTFKNANSTRFYLVLSSPEKRVLVT